MTAAIQQNTTISQIPIDILDSFYFAAIKYCHELYKILSCWKIRTGTGGVWHTLCSILEYWTRFSLAYARPDIGKKISNVQSEGNWQVNLLTQPNIIKRNRSRKVADRSVWIWINKDWLVTNLAFVGLIVEKPLSVGNPHQKRTAGLVLYLHYFFASNPTEFPL